MARVNLQGVTIFDSLMMGGNRFGVMSQTLSATFAVPSDAPHILVLDPGGAAREVDLPASPQVGDWFFIVNAADAAEVITLEDSASAALTPACTFTQNEVCLVIYTGATFGWRYLVGVA